MTQARGIDLTTIGARAATPAPDHPIFEHDKFRVPNLREKYDANAFLQLEIKMQELDRIIRNVQRKIEAWEQFERQRKMQHGTGN